MSDLSAHNNQKTDCPACHCQKGRLLGTCNDYAQWQCDRCRTVFAGIRAGSESASQLYDHYYDQARFEISPVVAVSLDRLVCSFSSFRVTGRVLDIGYGEGGLLRIAGNQGWKCYGADISPTALKYGENNGWVVSADAESDPRFPDHGFDVVTMIEFLEHVPEPGQFLQAAARWLRPGGLLYLTTPNAASLNQRFLGLEWSIFSPPEHLTIWTAKGLSQALTESGFQIQRIRTEGFNPSELIARYRPDKTMRETVSRNQAGLALNTAFSSTPFRRLLKSGINHCLSAFRAGDSLKVRAVRS